MDNDLKDKVVGFLGLYIASCLLASLVAGWPMLVAGVLGLLGCAAVLKFFDDIAGR